MVNDFTKEEAIYAIRAWYYRRDDKINSESVKNLYDAIHEEDDPDKVSDILAKNAKTVSQIIYDNAYAEANNVRLIRLRKLIIDKLPYSEPFKEVVDVIDEYLLSRTLGQYSTVQNLIEDSVKIITNEVKISLDKLDEI